MLKHPFYDVEQPIHSIEKFQINLETAVDTQVDPPDTTFVEVDALGLV